MRTTRRCTRSTSCLIGQTCRSQAGRSRSSPSSSGAPAARLPSDRGTAGRAGSVECKSAKCKVQNAKCIGHLPWCDARNELIARGHRPADHLRPLVVRQAGDHVQRYEAVVLEPPHVADAGSPFAEASGAGRCSQADPPARCVRAFQASAGTTERCWVAGRRPASIPAHGHDCRLHPARAAVLVLDVHDGRKAQPRARSLKSRTSRRLKWHSSSLPRFAAPPPLLPPETARRGAASGRRHRHDRARLIGARLETHIRDLAVEGLGAHRLDLERDIRSRLHAADLGLVDFREQVHQPHVGDREEHRRLERGGNGHPTSTARLTTMPSIGERMTVRSRSTCARLTPASALWMAACAP